VQKSKLYLLTGELLLWREPYSYNKLNYFDIELQHFIRPNQTYIDNFEKHGGMLVYEMDHHYQHKYAPEFAIAFKKEFKMNSGFKIPNDKCCLFVKCFYKNS